MSTHRPARFASVLIATVALTACAAEPAAVKQPALGTAVSAEELARWDISIPPSGAGLPAGSGTARLGLPVYEQKCLACHGARGVGKPADALAGGTGSLASKAPLRTVGSYWPYATTLFDYVRRAMPLADPLSLSDDDLVSRFGWFYVPHRDPRFLRRNLLVAAGNSEEPEAVGPIMNHFDHRSSLVRGHAFWALARSLGIGAWTSLRERYATEMAPDARIELEHALMMLRSPAGG